jgi:hypothetical protein
MNSSVYPGSTISTDVTQTEGIISVFMSNDEYGNLSGPITILGNTIYMTTMASSSSMMTGCTKAPVTLTKVANEAIMPYNGIIQIN